jgi:NodT family efflux transporter outer membrane factor (OMF) lipoprotein
MAPLPRRLRAVALCAMAALAGCALQEPPKPDEIRSQALPNLHAPAQWVATPAAMAATATTAAAPAAPAAIATTAAGTAAAPASAAPVRDDWLATFADPRLEALVREALAYNTDLQVAAARVEQAAAYAKLAGATIYPAVNLLAHGGGKLGGDNSGVNGGGLFASWELDLWGRVRSARAAGEAQYAAATADADYARQSLAATVAKSWMLAIEARLLRANAADVVHASEQSLGLARERLRVGIGDDYDVSLADAAVYTARDAERQLALGEAQARRALELLLGRFPAAEIEVASALPRVPGPVPAGLPSELLERRPDVVAAERRIAAAFHGVAEAKAARLPKIALTAGVTALSSNLFVLQDHANPVASLGANLAFPIFNGYALEAQVEIRTAEQALAIADYGRIGLRAFGEVESAMSAAAAADDREAILRASLASNSRSLELAQVRYRVGSGDLRGVLRENAAVYGARAALVHVQADQLVQRVNLLLALGGRFDTPPSVQGALDGTATPALAQVTPDTTAIPAKAPMGR